MEKTFVTMKKENERIYITETTFFKGETFNTMNLRVLHNDKDNEYYVILPDHTIIASESLKTLYKARRTIAQHYDDAIMWCFNHNEKLYY